METQELKKVNLELTDENPVALMMRFRREARRAKWPEEKIEEVLLECRSGSYEHLIATLAQYCE